MRAMTQSFIKPAEPLPLPREWHSAVFVSIGDDRLRRGGILLRRLHANTGSAHGLALHVVFDLPLSLLCVELCV